MTKKSLHQFYLDLIPNLLIDLFFFIPDKEIGKDIIEKIDFLKSHNVLNNIYVIDYDQGPIEYKKGRNNKHIFLKSGKLEQNIFNLIEKKSDFNEQEFNYVLNKYYELAECLFYVTNWMNSNLTQTVQTDDNVIGLFHIQFINYKKHFENLVKYLYPNKEAIPKGNFSALEIIETYFPDVSKSLEQNSTVKETILNPEKKPTKLNTTNKTETTTPTQQKTNILNKRRLIIEKAAEKKLLEAFFNITIIN